MNEYNTIGITEPLMSSDKLRKGDYIYEINQDSDLPFEKVMNVLSVNENGIVCVVNICTGDTEKINLLSDDLSNLQKLQLKDCVREMLKID